MSDHVQFTVDETGGFYVAISESVTVYEAYEDAVADIQQHLQMDADGFLAEVAIDDDGDTDDVAVTLEQVSWQQIIRDLPDQTATDTQTATVNTESTNRDQSSTQGAPKMDPTGGKRDNDED